VSNRSGHDQRNYRDLRERIERQERWREKNLKRIAELRRERHLHAFQRRSAALGSDEFGIAA